MSRTKTHNKNRAAAILRDRRAGRDTKHTIAVHVARVTEDEAARKGVIAALRGSAKKLRESGALGEVKTRVEVVNSDGRRGPVHRYTSAQVAEAAKAYKPRKAEYKAVRAALIAAAA